jgi:hypothetical protein
VVQSKIKSSNEKRCAQYDGQNGIEREQSVGNLYIADGFPHFLTRSGGFCTERFSSRWPRQTRALIGGDYFAHFFILNLPITQDPRYLLLHEVVLFFSWIHLFIISVALKIGCALSFFNRENCKSKKS